MLQQSPHTSSCISGSFGAVRGENTAISLVATHPTLPSRVADIIEPLVNGGLISPDQARYLVHLDTDPRSANDGAAGESDADRSVTPAQLRHCQLLEEIVSHALNKVINQQELVEALGCPASYDQWVSTLNLGSNESAGNLQADSRGFDAALAEKLSVINHQLILKEALYQAKNTGEEPSSNAASRATHSPLSSGNGLAADLARLATPDMIKAMQLVVDSYNQSARPSADKAQG